MNLGNVFKITKTVCMGAFLSICAQTGPVYREICHSHMLTDKHAMNYMFIFCCASTYQLQSNLGFKNKCFHNIQYFRPIRMQITMGLMSNKIENKQIQRRRTVLNSYRKVAETDKVGTILHTCVTTHFPG